MSQSSRPDSEQPTGDAPDAPLLREAVATVGNEAQHEPSGVVVPPLLPVAVMPSTGTLIRLDAAKKVARLRYTLLSRTILAVLAAVILIGGVLRYDAVPDRQIAPTLPPAAPDSQQVLRVGVDANTRPHLTCSTRNL